MPVRDAVFLFDPDKFRGGWHTGYGGGIWIALRGTRSTLSIAYATSTQDSGLYVTMGFAY